VGHYENGDTLVIDTIGISPKSFVDNYRTPHTDDLHVVERWKLAADGQAVEGSVFVEDPGTFTTPYTAGQRWRRVGNPAILPGPVRRNHGVFLGRGFTPVAGGGRAVFLSEGRALPGRRPGRGGWGAISRLNRRACACGGRFRLRRRHARRPAPPRGYMTGCG